jgi:hypothetical protein
MNESFKNRVDLVIKAFGPLLVLAGLIAGIVQYSRNAKDDRVARHDQYVQTIAEARREAKKPFYEQQLSLYLEATNVASRISDPISADDRKAAIVRFWQLYWGPLALVESLEVEQAMVHFKDVLQNAELTDSQRIAELHLATINLAHKCRVSLKKSWDVDLPSLDTTAVSSPQPRR